MGNLTKISLRTSQPRCLTKQVSTMLKKPEPPDSGWTSTRSNDFGLRLRKVLPTIFVAPPAQAPWPILDLDIYDMTTRISPRVFGNISLQAQKYFRVP
jgi:hypothetical protein